MIFFNTNSNLAGIDCESLSSPVGTVFSWLTVTHITINEFDFHAIELSEVEEY